MRLRTSLLLAVGLALLGWAGGWFAADVWRRSAAGRAERSSVQVKEVTKKPAEPAKSAAAAAVTTRYERIISLPPLGTPVKEVVAQLKEQADAGNVQASCRVAMDLMRCRQVRDREAGLENVRRRLKVLKPGTNEFMATRDLLETQARAMQGDRRACEGVDGKAMDAAWKYLLRAAQGGHPESMSLFIAAPPLPPSAIEDIEGYTAYRDFAPFFIESQLKAGDVRTAYVMFMQYAHDGRGTYGGKLFDRDPQKALAFAHLLLPLVDMPSADRIRRDMRILEAEAAVDTPLAIRDAERMRRENFARSSPIDASNGLGTPLPASCNAAD